MSACEEMIKRGLTICHGGAYFEVKNGKFISCDPIVAALIVNNKMPELDFNDLELMSKPGIVAAACEFLEVDAFWLYRFWMGYDRGYQILISRDLGSGDKKKTVTKKDDVSEFGIQLHKALK
jgi:hypothetical protein